VWGWLWGNVETASHGFCGWEGLKWAQWAKKLSKNSQLPADPLFWYQYYKFPIAHFFAGDVSYFSCNPKIFQVIFLATKNFPIEFLCSEWWVSKMSDSVIGILYSDRHLQRNRFEKILGQKGNDLGHWGNKRTYWNL
jgi:hypothetical protein